MKNNRLAAFVTFVATWVALVNPPPLPASLFQGEEDQNAVESGKKAGSEPEILSGEILLKKDTEVNVVFAQSLSSKHAVIDEKVELRVAEDVISAGIVVIPRGARVIGTVTTGKKNEKYGNSKTVAVRVDYVLLKDKRIPLTGAREQRPDTNVGAAAAATVGLGVSGLLIYMNQRESWIREGTKATGYVAEDVILSP